MASTAVVVDDHPSFRRFARRLMEAAGFVVVGEAGDGASALAAVRDTRPRLVLLDVLLPDADGFDVAEWLAAEPCPPVVLLTSSRSAADLAQPLTRSSADGFVSKSDLSRGALAPYLGETGER